MSDFYAGVPSSPKTFPIRPLTGGMVRNTPTALLPDGAGLDVVGAHVYAEGLQRRGGIKVHRKGSTLVPIPFLFADEVLQDCFMYVTSTGVRQFMVLSNRALYREISGVFTPVHWVQDYTITTLVSTTITDSTSGRDFVDDNVIAGMYVVLSNTVSGELETYAIVSCTASTIVLTSAPSGTYAASFYIVRHFNAEDPLFVDWTLSSTRAYFTDGYPTGVVYYDGSVLQKLLIVNSDSDETFLGCRAIDFFGDRLWFGYCYEADGDIIRNRIRWSTALNDARVEDESYQDLTGFGGEILKLRALGSINMCYLTDGIAYGRQSNLTSLPYVYTKIETGSIGLVGMRAVTGFLNTHFFVGLDDIYAVGESATVERLGSAINSVALIPVTKKSHIIAQADPMHRRVVFGFPTTSSRVEVIYSLYYETKAWSRSYLEASMIGSSGSFTAPVLGDYPTETWNDFPGLSYNAFKGEISDITMFYGDYLGFLYTISDDSTSDDNPVSDGSGGWTVSTTAIPFTFETRDFDFDAPDDMKSALRLGARIYDVTGLRTTNLNLVVEGSTDKGRNWKTLGTMRIRSSDDESAVNFRLTGSIMRFRVRTTANVPPFRLEELTLRVRGRGLEVQVGDAHGA